MERCGEVDKIISLWEETGILSDNDSKRIRAHINECNVCRKKFSPLLLLISGEARNENPFQFRSLQESEAGTSSIMGKIGNSSPKKRDFTFRSYFPGAAAAAVIIILFTIYQLIPDTVDNQDFVIVEFRLAAPSVDSVSLVGDFNNWGEDGIELTDTDKDGIWTIAVTLKRGNLYKYNFIIDNEIWIADPESEITLDDGFGGKSSVIHI